MFTNNSTTQSVQSPRAADRACIGFLLALYRTVRYMRHGDFLQAPLFATALSSGCHKHSRHLVAHCKPGFSCGRGPGTVPDAHHHQCYQARRLLTRIITRVYASHSTIIRQTASVVDTTGPQRFCSRKVVRLQGSVPLQSSSSSEIGMKGSHRCVA